MSGILTSRNKEKYTHDGFSYVKDNKSSSDGNKLFWCCDRRPAGCKGRIWTSADGNRTFLRLVTPHTCSEIGDAVRVSVQKAVSNVKRRALTTMENPAQIRSAVVQDITQATMGQLPNNNAMRKIVQRTRTRGQGTRSPPLFPHTIWNVYDRTINHQDRTNNYCEAFHRKVQLQLGFAHPTIFKFLDSLKKIVKVSDSEYENFVAGHNPQRKRRRYEQADNRILTIVNRPFDVLTVLEYLRGISHNYQMM